MDHKAAAHAVLPGCGQALVARLLPVGQRAAVIIQPHDERSSPSSGVAVDVDRDGVTCSHVLGTVDAHVAGQGTPHHGGRARQERNHDAGQGPGVADGLDRATVTRRPGRRRQPRKLRSSVAIPEDFQPLDPSPFSELVGPVYVRDPGSAPVLGVRVQPQHANRAGRAHGGLLMTLADIAVSRVSALHLPPGSTIATASLQIAFLRGVSEGQWLQAVPRVDRLGRALVHASCSLRTEDEEVANVLATISVRLPTPG
jgi:acyl-coenzyme A thioesterase 13